MPLFMGITGVNEHVEPVFDAVLPSAVVMQRSLDILKNHLYALAPAFKIPYLLTILYNSRLFYWYVVS